MQKRGISSTLTHLIFLLLGLLMVGVLWLVVSNLISNGINDVNPEKLGASVKIVYAEINKSGSSSLIVKNKGNIKLSGILVTITNGTNSQTLKLHMELKELEAKEFLFEITELNPSSVNLISILPLFISKSGEEIIGTLGDEIKITQDNFIEGEIITNLNKNLVVDLNFQNCISNTINKSWNDFDSWDFKTISIINCPSSNINDISGIEILINLKKLSLIDNEISVIPKEIGTLKELTSVYLQKNKISSIPDEITNLSTLNKIYLDENNILSLPLNIGNLANLKELFLSDNNLTSLPSSIGNLGKLNKSVFFNNNLNSIPSSIGNLANLSDLQLQNNNLTSLPSSIGNLSNLNYLYLADNNLNSLPVEIGNLINLKILQLNNNKLGGIPSAKSGMNLEKLWIAPNTGGLNCLNVNVSSWGIISGECN